MIDYSEKTIQEASAITCDRCGRRTEKEQDVFEYPECISIDHTCGYGSIIGDEVRYQVDLCQHCVRELLMPFARIV